MDATQTLLGEIVAWDLGSTEVSLQSVRDSLNAAGLDPDSVSDMMPRAAFGRACKHLKENRTIDKVSTANGIITFQFTKKELDGDRLEFDYETVVRLDTGTGDIDSDLPELAEKARDLFAHARQTRTNTDITRLVQRLFRVKADLFSISPKGVAYFVPEAHREFTGKVERFLTEMGGRLYRFPVPQGTAEGNLSVKNAVQAGLTELLGELNESVEGWNDTTRKSTMDRAMERWQTIKYKVEAYKTYLGAEQDRLQKALVEAKEALAKKIAALAPEDEDASEEQADEEEELVAAQ